MLNSGIIRFQESRYSSLVAVIADPNREIRALEGAADLLIDSDIASIIREEKTAKELKQLKADHVNEIAEIKKENEFLRAELVAAVDERDELKAALTRRPEGDKLLTARTPVALAHMRAQLDNEKEKAAALEVEMKAIKERCSCLEA